MMAWIRTVVRTRPNTILAVSLLVVACVLPLGVSEFRLLQLSLILVYALALLGLTLLTGYNGQISLGHGAFYALGAYVTAISMEHLGLPYWATFVPAAIICMAVGLVIGVPALRLPGHHLALATFALAMVLPQLLRHRILEPWTGGGQGIFLDKPRSPVPGLSDDRWLYYLTLLVVALAFAGAAGLVQGRIGRAIRATRDHPAAAVAMGISTSYVKCVMFGISAALTGTAGALSAVIVQFVAPDSFQVFFSIALLVGAVFGGLTSLWGPVLGAVFIQFVPFFAETLSKSAPLAVYGIILIGAMFVAPAGATGLVGRLFNRRRSSDGGSDVPSRSVADAVASGRPAGGA